MFWRFWRKRARAVFMTGSIRVKICGLTDAEAVAAATRAGAAYVGFNFFEPSPRYISPDAAREIAVDVVAGVCKVALTVNFDDAAMDRIIDAVPLDMVQLHGSESPERVSQIRSRYGLPVMKVLGIADAEDLPAIETYEDVADQILVDAKSPKNSVLPGGNGISFDWRLIANRKWRKPWMLAGGLTPDNVAEAIALTGAVQVDVASGVESAPGVKDADLVSDFVRAAQSR